MTPPRPHWPHSSAAGASTTSSMTSPLQCRTGSYLAEQVGAKPSMRLPAWLGRLAAGEVAVMMTGSAAHRTPRPSASSAGSHPGRPGAKASRRACRWPDRNSDEPSRLAAVAAEETAETLRPPMFSIVTGWSAPWPTRRTSCRRRSSAISARWTMGGDPLPEGVPRRSSPGLDRPSPLARTRRETYVWPWLPERRDRQRQ